MTARATAAATPALWAWRAVLVIAAAALALLSVLTTLARASAIDAPLAALRLWPADAQAKSIAAEAIAGHDRSARGLAQVQQFASAALARDATASGAVALLGLVADLRGHRAHALTLMNAADQLSRRDLLPRLWLIQEAVDRGDVAGALKHFDVALRTSPDARKLLYPILANATNDPGLQRPIARLLGDAPWASDFIYAAATGAQPLGGLAHVVAAMPSVPSYPGTDLRELIAATLVARGELATARAFGLRFTPGARGATVADPAFADEAGLAPITWQLADSDGVSAERSTSDSGKPELAVTSDVGVGGVAATQLLALAPGRYRLSSTRPDGAGYPAPAPEWSLVCTRDGAALATLPLVGQDQPAAEFAVPAACATQWLRLTVRAHDNSDTVPVRIARVDVTRLP